MFRRLWIVCVLVAATLPLAAQNGARNGEWRAYAADPGSTKYSPLARSTGTKKTLSIRLGVPQRQPRPKAHLTCSHAARLNDVSMCRRNSQHRRPLNHTTARCSGCGGWTKGNAAPRRLLGLWTRSPIGLMEKATSGSSRDVGYNLVG